MSSVRRVRNWLFPALAVALFLALGISSILLLTTKKRTLDSLIITTIPSGATVLLDGRLVGPSPVRVDHVELGTHSIQATKEGFLPFEERAEIVEDLDEPLTFELRAEPPKGTKGGSVDDHVAEYTRLAETAFEREHYVTPYPESALYYADAVRSVARASTFPGEMRIRIQAALLERARRVDRRDPAARVTILDQLERAFPNDPDVEAAIRAEDAQIGTSVTTVVHLHGSGSCTGALSTASTILRFVSSVREHSFTTHLNLVRLSSMGRTLRVHFNGRTEQFRFPTRTASTRFASALERLRRN